MALVAYPFRALVVMYRVLAIINWYKMINVWDTVSTFIHLPRMFLSMDVIFEQQIRQFTMDFLDIIFTY